MYRLCLHFSSCKIGLINWIQHHSRYVQYETVMTGSRFSFSSMDFWNRIDLLQGFHASSAFLSDNRNVKTVTNVVQRWNKLRCGNRSVKREIVSVSISTTNLIFTGPFFEMGIRHDRPAN